MATETDPSPRAYDTEDPEPDSSSERQGRGRASGHGVKAILWVLGGLLLVLPTVSLPNTGGWLGIKAFALEAAGIILSLFVVSRGDWTWARIRAALVAAPNVAILAFLAWVGLSAARSPLPQLSRYEAMRHLGGGLIYFSLVYGLSVRRHLPRLVEILLLAGSVGALLAFMNFSETGATRVSGAFRNGQLLAAFLCLLLPVVMMAAVAGEENWSRIAAQVATVIVAAGVLLSQNRSAWFGSLLSLIVMGILYFRHAASRKGSTLQKHQLLVPVVMVMMVVGLFAWLSTTPGVKQRVETVTKHLGGDESFNWRLGMWSKAARIIRKQPVFGCGVGVFPIEQALYYHPDSPGREQKDILLNGATMSENAHNTYFQVGAEMGLPGLAIYLSIFVAFFFTAGRALSRLRPGYRQSLLIGSVAAVSGQMVAAIGSPAWEFPECSLMLWMMLGIGMAIAGVGDRGREAGEKPQGGEKRGRSLP
jgi:O-antigen ligase